MRLDAALAETGLVESRQRAQVLVMAGSVKVNGATERRPARLVRPEDRLDVESGDSWASRGALKLGPALDAFAIDVAGRVCADIGASTGGFTDVLLRRGAARVFAIDVGRGLLHSRLLADQRVTALERTNARDLVEFPQAVDLVTMDLSFIGLEKVLPAIRRAAPAAEVVALFKPQFQVGRGAVPRGGVVRDPAVVAAARAAFEKWCADNGYLVLGSVPAAVTGAEGNQEHLYRLAPR